MKTDISPSNPFGANRYGYLWETLRAYGEGGRHLDFGTYDGAVPHHLLRTGVVSEAWAVDVVDAQVNYERSFGKGLENLRFGTVSQNGALPLGDASIDSISLLDVLEHVADQARLLGELHRVLKPGGLLVVTVPQRHVLSFLDAGNWKFLFPGLHAWWYSTRYSKEQYHERYVSPSNGLIGDIEIEKSWHEHFTPRGLVHVLRRGGFDPFHLDGAGLFARPLSLVRYLAPSVIHQALDRAMAADARTFSSTHLFSTSRRL